MIHNCLQSIIFLIENFEQVFDGSLYSDDKLMTDEEINQIAMPFIEPDDFAIEVQRMALRTNSSIPFDYEYSDRLLGLKYPTN